jgi:hypothetical protein
MTVIRLRAPWTSLVSPNKVLWTLYKRLPLATVNPCTRAWDVDPERLSKRVQNDRVWVRRGQIQI